MDVMSWVRRAFALRDELSPDDCEILTKDMEMPKTIWTGYILCSGLVFMLLSVLGKTAFSFYRAQLQPGFRMTLLLWMTIIFDIIAIVTFYILVDRVVKVYGMA